MSPPWLLPRSGPPFAAFLLFMGKTFLLLIMCTACCWVRARERARACVFSAWIAMGERTRCSIYQNARIVFSAAAAGLWRTWLRTGPPSAAGLLEEGVGVGVSHPTRAPCWLPSTITSGRLTELLYNVS